MPVDMLGHFLQILALILFGAPLPEVIAHLDWLLDPLM